GTAKDYKPEHYLFAGKTGTARTDYYNPGSPRKQYTASFAGYFPADNPKYSCLVVVYDPVIGGFYGATAALPIFRKIADRCMGVDRALLAEQTLPDTVAYREGLRLAGWSQKEEINELIDAMSLRASVTGEGDWARLMSGREIGVEVNNILEKNAV